MSNEWKKINWAIFILLGLIGIGHGTIIDLIWGDSLPSYLYPRTPELFKKLSSDWELWLMAIFYTTITSLTASIISLFFGLLAGSTFAFFRLWSLDKIFQLIWSIPLIAISVYLLLAVGYNSFYGVVLGIFLGFYPIEKYTYDYCITPNEGVLSLCGTFGLSRLQEFKHLRVPGAFRNVGTALSQSVPLCFIGETMGEYTTGRISASSVGLGGLLRQAHNNSDYPGVWLCIILLMFLVYLSGLIISLAWKRFWPYREIMEDVA